MANSPDEEDVQTYSGRQSDKNHLSRQLEIATGRGLVNRLETMICGSGAVEEAAVAEGLSMAGVRTATLLTGTAASQCEQLVAGTRTGPYVHHVTTGLADRLTTRYAYVLVSGTHQETVDHCLWAHLLAERTGQPVLSVVEERVAGKFGLANVPDLMTIQKILGPFLADPEPVSGVEVAVSCGRQVGKILGRPCTPAVLLHARSALKLLVGLGSLAERAQEVLELWGAPEAACGVLSIKMLRPFPIEQLLDVATKNARLFALHTRDSYLSQELLSTLNSAVRTEELSSSVVIPVPLENEAVSGVELAKSLERADPTAVMLSTSPREPQPGSPSVQIGITPSAPWYDRVLLETAKTLERSYGISGYQLIRECASGYSVLRLGREPTGSLDALLVLDNDLVNPQIAISKVRDHGRIVICSAHRDPVAIVQDLQQPLQMELKGRQIELWSLPPSKLEQVSGESELHRMLTGAAVGALTTMAAASEEADPISDIARQLLLDGSSDAEVELFQMGANGLERIPFPEVASTLANDLAALDTTSQPVLEEQKDNQENDSWQSEIHRFHMTGKTTKLARSALPDLPLLPAILPRLETDGGLENHYPFYLPEPEVEGIEPQPLSKFLKELLERCEQKGGEFRILKDNLSVIASFLNRPANESIDRLKPELFIQAQDLLDLSEKGEVTLKKELQLLQSELDESGRLIRFGKASLLDLYAWAALHEQLPCRQRLLEEARQLVVGLEDLLLLDRQNSPEGRSPETVASTIGEQGKVLLDSAAFSNSIPTLDGPVGLSSDRRKRIEKARDALSGFLADSKDAPPFYLVHSQPLEGPVDIPKAADIRHEDAFSAALGLFEGLMVKMVDVFKALRIARLEIACDYDPDLHDALLEQFEWQSCEAYELRATTPVVVLESAEQLCLSRLSSFSRALRAGRPLNILISAPNLPSSDCYPEREMSGHFTDLGYLTIAHREAFVLQSSLVQPKQVLEGLRKLAASLRPAVAIISGPSCDTDPAWHWPQSVIAHLSRSTPAFVYDPDAGSSWAECFALELSPDPEKPWVEVSRPATAPNGSEQVQEEALTFAHAAALFSSYRRHFLPIPRETWKDDQIEIGSYLASCEKEPPKAIPFIRVLGPNQTLQRAVVSRALVNASRERQRSWRTLQELAGINNEYVRQAIEQTRQEIESAARVEIEAIGKRERSEGAAQAIDRLVAFITSQASITVESTSPDSISVESAEQPPSQVEPEVMAPPVGAVEDEEEFSAEPYIDSFLCTSCNDCTNLNPLLFKYNEDKQAIIGDLSAGTFLQLVKAAEVCPAKCIHPGSPAEDDKTATAEVIARAQAFQ